MAGLHVLWLVACLPNSGLQFQIVSFNSFNFVMNCALETVELLIQNVDTLQQAHHLISTCIISSILFLVVLLSFVFNPCVGFADNLLILRWHNS